jgi:hypothetical protein
VADNYPVRFLFVTMIAVIASVGCARSTDADRERLQRLKTDPLAAVVPPDQTAPAVLTRDEVAEVPSAVQGQAGTSFTQYFERSPDDNPYELLQFYRDVMLEQGWQEVEANCSAPPVVRGTIRVEEGYAIVGSVSWYDEGFPENPSPSEPPLLVLQLWTSYHTKPGPSFASSSDTSCL